MQNTIIKPIINPMNEIPIVHAVQCTIVHVEKTLLTYRNRRNTPISVFIYNTTVGSPFAVVMIDEKKTQLIPVAKRNERDKLAYHGQQ